MNQKLQNHYLLNNEDILKIKSYLCYFYYKQILTFDNHQLYLTWEELKSELNNIYYLSLCILIKKYNNFDHFHRNFDTLPYTKKLKQISSIMGHEVRKQFPSSHLQRKKPELQLKDNHQVFNESNIIDKICFDDITSLVKKELNPLQNQVFKLYFIDHLSKKQIEKILNTNNEYLNQIFTSILTFLSLNYAGNSYI